MSSDQHSVNQSIAPVAPSRPGTRQPGESVDPAIGRTWRIVLLTLLLAYFLLGMAFLALRYVVLPNIGQYQPHIESFASHAVGQPVTIGRVEGGWQGLSPRLVFKNVMIRDSLGKQALHLPSVSAVVSWWSVATASLRLHSLEILHPDLEVVRNRSGQLFIAGVPIDLTREGDGKSLDWLLTQHEIVIRGGAIRWSDRQRNAPELVLSEVELVLLNEGNRHQLAIKASPPSHIATPLDVRADFHTPSFAARFSDAKQWKGTVYADWGNTDLSAWKAYINYPFDVTAGKGSLRTWLYFDRTQVTNFIADVSLSDLVMRMRDDLEVLDLVQVQGRILAQEANGRQPRHGDEVFGQNGYTVALSDLSLEARNGLRLSSTTVSQTYTPPTGMRPERREVRAKVLDVGAMAKLAVFLPLSRSDRRFLADFAPRGELHDFYARSEGTYPHISAYRIRGHFRELGLNAQAPRPARPKWGKRPAQLAVPGIPGFEKVSGYVDGNQEGGRLQLDSREAIIHLPGYLPVSAMPFEQLNLDAQWSWKAGNRFIFQIEEMSFVQEETAGNLSGRYTVTVDDHMGPGTVNLVAHVPSFDIKRLPRYLPTVTPPGLHDWLSTALVDGHLKDVKLFLKGDLQDLPFTPQKPGAKPNGEFSVTARIQDGVLDYLPRNKSDDGKKPLWPLLEEVNGWLDINQTRLAIRADSAMTHQVVLSDIEAVIPDLMSKDAMLNVTGKASGRLQDFVRYTQDSPVAGWIGRITEDTVASGLARLDLTLNLPFRHVENTEVRGMVEFADNDIRLLEFLPPLLAANGRLTFNEKGFGLEDVHAKFAGGRIGIDGGMREDRTVEVRAQGRLSSKALTTVFPGDATQRLLQHVVGDTWYSAVIRVKDTYPEVIVQSSMRGIGLDLPSPLHKQSGEAMPMKVEWRMLNASRSGMLQDELKIALGKTFAAHYTREKPEGKDASWKVVRGGIGINVPAQQPDIGLFAHVDLPTLDLDAWRNAVYSITGAKQQNGAQASMQADYGGLSQYMEPDAVAARAAQLILLGKRLDKVIVGASKLTNVWQANLDSAQVSGYVTWNTGDFQETSGKVTARLTSLIIPEDATTDVTELLEGKDATTELPALDIVADKFEFGGIQLGSLNLIANNSYVTGRREWHIDKLAISNEDGIFKAQGKWTSHNQQNVSTLNYSLDISDAGNLLSRLGYEGVLRRGKGSLSGKLQWNDLPFALHKASLGGELKLEVANGQFIKVEPGAAKLLGVLSLQSLPRRLTFDFSDIFSEGLAFDTIAGTARIADGVLSTDNLKMRSVNAAVLLEGKADIVQETQALRVVVVPEINAGGASVVYGLVANPVVGLGSFLAQLFLSDPLRQAFTVEYDINGPWHDPVVRKAERNSSASASIHPTVLF